MEANARVLMAAIVRPPSISWMEIFKRTWKEAEQDDVFGRAAQLSYYFFLAVFPLMICMLAVLGFLSSVGQHIREALLYYLGGMLPGTAFEVIQTTLTQISPEHAGTKVSLGLLFSLWSASAGMSAMMDTLNAEHEVREGRSFIRRNAIAIGLTVAASLLILAAIAMIVAGGPTAEAFTGGIVSLLLKVIAWPIATGLVLLGFALIYFFAPDIKEQKWHWVTPGSVAALILWLLVSFALKIYLHFFDRYSLTYGSLGAVAILLLWFYLSGLAVLFGGEINTVIEHAAAAEGVPDAKLKGEKAPGDAESKTNRQRLAQQSRSTHA
jgi:membrane protein